MSTKYQSLDTQQTPKHTDENHFSFIVAFAFSINFAMGAGFLSLPWAFYQSGVILGLLMFIVIAIPLVLSIPFNLEAMARADAVFRFRRRNDSFRDTDPLVNTETGEPQTMSQLMTDGNLVVKRDKFELYELCELFIGPVAKYCFIACLVFYTYGCLWAFAAVFAEALTVSFPLPVEEDYTAYLIYLALFAAIVVPLSCMELNEQMYMQVFLAICRLVVVIFIVSTAFIAYVTHDDVLEHAQPAPMFNIHGITIVLPVAAYAFAFTQSMPALSEPVRDKTELKSIFQSTVYACFIGYSLIGLVVSLAFGDAVQQSCNLNWSSYTAGGTTNPFIALIGKIVKRYVIMFPALDVASAFPLMAITLGNNMFSAVYGHSSKRMSRWYTIAFRLLAGIPPICGAVFVSDLGEITDYTGIAGIILAFFFPPLLAKYSEKYFDSKKWNPHTVYSNEYSGKAIRRGVFWFSSALVVFVTISSFL